MTDYLWLRKLVHVDDENFLAAVIIVATLSLVLTSTAYRPPSSMATQQMNKLDFTGYPYMSDVFIDGVDSIKQLETL